MARACSSSWAPTKVFRALLRGQWEIGFILVVKLHGETVVEEKAGGHPGLGGRWVWLVASVS